MYETFKSKDYKQKNNKIGQKGGRFISFFYTPAYFWLNSVIRHVSKMCRNQWHEKIRNEAPRRRKQ